VYQFVILILPKMVNLEYFMPINFLTLYSREFDHSNMISVMLN